MRLNSFGGGIQQPLAPCPGVLVLRVHDRLYQLNLVVSSIVATGWSNRNNHNANIEKVFIITTHNLPVVRQNMSWAMFLEVRAINKIFRFDETPPGYPGSAHCRLYLCTSKHQRCVCGLRI